MTRQLTSLAFDSLLVLAKWVRLSFGLHWDNSRRNWLISPACVLSSPLLLYSCALPAVHLGDMHVDERVVMSQALSFNKQSFTHRSFCDLHPCRTRGVKRGDWFMARPILEWERGRRERWRKAVDLLSSSATKGGRECAYVNPLAERWSKTGTSWALLIASGQTMLSKQLGKCADEE